MSKKIGDRILELMKKSDFTQRELATMVGVTEAAISRYINNEREPKVEVIANLATALETTTDYLIYGTSSEEDFSEIYRLVARSTISMSDEEKLRLIKLLMEK
jgi:transcriptional regulator with XRE-family HTH domain